MHNHDDETLYNCCARGKEPDWTQFDAIEVNCCATELTGHDDETTTNVVSLQEAQFFTVYGHLKCGGVEAITDVPNRRIARQIARLFARRIGGDAAVWDCCLTDQGRDKPVVITGSPVVLVPVPPVPVPQRSGAKLDERELGTVLAALRYWQMAQSEIWHRGFQSIHDEIATDGGKFDSLANDEIDELCERLNCGPDEKEPADAEYIEAARLKNIAGDDTEIDDKPKVSRGDGGAFVAAWVWVSNDSLQGGA